MRRTTLLTTLFLAACGSNPEASRRTLDDAGYSDIEITGWEFWGCGEDDDYSTGFIATNPKGKRIEGIVCCGWGGKGCTIRH